MLLVEITEKNSKLAFSFRELLKETVEALLEAEMDEHLGYSKHDSSGDNTGNSRNGYSSKLIITSQGTVKINVPRDRNGEFKPRLIAKRRNDIRGIEERLVAMHVLPDRLLSEQIDKVYNRLISPSLIDRAVGKLKEVKAKRRMGPVLDAMR